MREEFYYNIRLRQDQTLKPIWVVPALPGREPDGRVVAWAREREDGGRGFGTTVGHFYDNWKHDDFRRLLLNAIGWSAGVEVPEGGVESSFYTHEEIRAALAGVEGTERARVEPPIRALILTGHQYPGHKWRETTPVIQSSLEQDARFQVSVSTDIEDLAGIRPGSYDVLILNYCNWEDPTGLSEPSKRAFVGYLQGGGGLTLIHFANGAWHYSLPKAGASDWPEFRKICRRVWDHKSDSGHDPYGPFTLEIADVRHPITEGMTTVRDDGRALLSAEGRRADRPAGDGGLEGDEADRAVGVGLWIREGARVSDGPRSRRAFSPSGRCGAAGAAGHGLGGGSRSAKDRPSGCRSAGGRGDDRARQ